MTPNQSQGIGHQRYPSCMNCSTLSPNFLLASPTISRFWDISHLGFTIDSHVKISKCHKFCKTWLISKASNSLHSPMVNNVLIKFGWDPMKTVGEVAFWNFSSTWSCFKKNVKVQYFLQFLADHQKSIVPYITPWLWYFVWSLIGFWLKLLEEQRFQNRRIRNFAMCTNWPETKLKQSGMKNTLYMQCSTPPRAPNFRPFRSTISCFRDIQNF